MRKKKLLKYAIRIHIYAGLFASVFLIIAGFSAINFQHDLLSTEPRDTIYYNQDVHITKLPPDSLSQDITRQLGIRGYTPIWDWRFDKDKNLKEFKIHRPARRFIVSLNHQAGTASVAEIRFRTGAILEFMHKTTIVGLPDPQLIAWAIYGQLSAVGAFLAILVSFYFWWTKSISNRWEWLVAGVFFSGVVIFILYLWLVG